VDNFKSSPGTAAPPGSQTTSGASGYISQPSRGWARYFEKRKWVAAPRGQRIQNGDLNGLTRLQQLGKTRVPAHQPARGTAVLLEVRRVLSLNGLAVYLDRGIASDECQTDSIAESFLMKPSPSTTKSGLAGRFSNSPATSMIPFRDSLNNVPAARN